ncbi:nuclease [Candidatus Marinamargulisbacteria bacterium SCGC AG-439-L15]|nr:nuclease [Candidatus Marinamargulisbacteria bacterium SCGC AG-439-L15]
MFKIMRNHVFFLISCCCFLNFLIAPSSAQAPIKGRVIRVIDGDTVWFQPRNQQKLKLRLLGIDAPELKKPYGKASKKELHQKCTRVPAEIILKGKDRYSRHLGILYCNGQNMNEWLVRQGLAHAYKKTKNKVYKVWEIEAAYQKRGMWKEKKKQNKKKIASPTSNVRPKK